jgi:hypothetical protein
MLPRSASTTTASRGLSGGPNKPQQHEHNLQRQRLLQRDQAHPLDTNRLNKEETTTASCCSTRFVCSLRPNTNSTMLATNKKKQNKPRVETVVAVAVAAATPKCVHPQRWPTRMDQPSSTKTPIEMPCHRHHDHTVRRPYGMADETALWDSVAHFTVHQYARTANVEDENVIGSRRDPSRRHDSRSPVRSRPRAALNSGRLLARTATNLSRRHRQQRRCCWRPSRTNEGDQDVKQHSYCLDNNNDVQNHGSSDEPEQRRRGFAYVHRQLSKCTINAMFVRNDPSRTRGNRDLLRRVARTVTVV